MSDEVVLGDLSGLTDGSMQCVEAGGEDGIVVCRVGGVLYALADNCSHADTPLSEGRLRGYGITCPLHGASFDVRDGSHSGPPAWESVACYAVREVDGVAVAIRQEPETDDTSLVPDTERFRTR